MAVGLSCRSFMWGVPAFAPFCLSCCRSLIPVDVVTVHVGWKETDPVWTQQLCKRGSLNRSVKDFMLSVLSLLQPFCSVKGLGRCSVDATCPFVL